MKNTFASFLAAAASDAEQTPSQSPCARIIQLISFSCDAALGI
ncbi:MAG: hypothetical protein QXT87_05225 [Thermoproteota archaeon]